MTWQNEYQKLLFKENETKRLFQERSPVILNTVVASFLLILLPSSTSSNLFILFISLSMSLPPAFTITAPQSPARSGSVSQPIREGVAAENSPYATGSIIQTSRSAMLRSQSSNTVQRPAGPSTSSSSNSHAANPNASLGKAAKGRARSSSLVTVTEVGGDEPENVVDRLGVGTNENANWVNAPGECRLVLYRRAVLTLFFPFRSMAYSPGPHTARKSIGRCYPRHDSRCQLDDCESRLHGGEQHSRRCKLTDSFHS